MLRGRLIVGDYGFCLLDTTSSGERLKDFSNGIVTSFTTSKKGKIKMQATQPTAFRKMPFSALTSARLIKFIYG